MDEVLEAQQKLESCKKEITSLERMVRTGYIEAGGVFYNWKTVISADLTPRYKTEASGNQNQKERNSRTKSDQSRDKKACSLNFLERIKTTKKRKIKRH